MFTTISIICNVFPRLDAPSKWSSPSSLHILVCRWYQPTPPCSSCFDPVIINKFGPISGLHSFPKNRKKHIKKKHHLLYPSPLFFRGGGGKEPFHVLFSYHIGSSFPLQNGHTFPSLFWRYKSLAELWKSETKDRESRIATRLATRETSCDHPCGLIEPFPPRFVKIREMLEFCCHAANHPSPKRMF